MKREKNFFVSYCMSFSPVYVKETDTLLNAIEAMKNFKIDSIPVINDGFSVIGHLTKKKIRDIFKLNCCKSVRLLKDFKVSDIIGKDRLPIVFYPKMRIKEAYSFMKHFNNICIPIVNEPWEKKMLGVIWLDDVLSVMKELSA